MITGEFVPGFGATVPAQLLGARGSIREVEALIDTGFDGDLLIPEALANALELDFVIETLVTLADGREERLRTYSGRIVWDGLEREINVLAAAGGDPLLGLGLLEGYHLGIEVVDGGRVQIRRLRE